jgi:hypothetical protein
MFIGRTEMRSASYSKAHRLEFQHQFAWIVAPKTGCLKDYPSGSFRLMSRLGNPEEAVFAEYATAQD